MKAIDLTGKIFGRLTVTRREFVEKSKDAMWLCSCECGNHKIVSSHNLKIGNTASCGCLQIESRTRPRKSITLESIPGYHSWHSMVDRCTNQRSRLYKNWGGRGITISADWLKSFQNFINDMGERPSPTHSIDRINNDGNYCKENCRWATKTEQSRNTRIQINNKTGITGVHWYKRDKKYRAFITVNNKPIYLGGDNSIEEAKRMRAEGELKYWGKSS